MECVKKQSKRNLVREQLSLNCLDVGIIQSVMSIPTSERAIELYSLVYNK